mgnify:CR=1 FL=1
MAESVNLSVFQGDSLTLNVFYKDEAVFGDDVYTIQPSIYYVVKDSQASSRIYLNAF